MRPYDGAALECRVGETGVPRENPKTRRQAASSSTIPTCENPGANPPGIELGSPCWKASALSTALPLSVYSNNNTLRGERRGRLAAGERGTRHTAGTIQAELITSFSGTELLNIADGQTTPVPPRRTELDSRQYGSRIFARSNRVVRCRWSVSYLGDLPFTPPLRSAAAPYSRHFTLIGSQDLDVKRLPNLFTPPHSRAISGLRKGQPAGHSLSHYLTGRACRNCSTSAREPGTCVARNTPATSSVTSTVRTELVLILRCRRIGAPATGSSTACGSYVTEQASMQKWNGMAVSLLRADWLCRALGVFVLVVSYHMVTLYFLQLGPVHTCGHRPRRCRCGTTAAPQQRVHCYGLFTGAEEFDLGGGRCKGTRNGRSPRKPADQRHLSARFPHVKIQERPRRESNPFRLDGRRGLKVRGEGRTRSRKANIPIETMNDLFNILHSLKWTMYGAGRGVVARLLTSHIDEPVRFPAGSLQDFRMWESCRKIPLVARLAVSGWLVVQLITPGRRLVSKVGRPAAGVVLAVDAHFLTHSTCRGTLARSPRQTPPRRSCSLGRCRPSVTSSNRLYQSIHDGFQPISCGAVGWCAPPIWGAGASGFESRARNGPWTSAGMKGLGKREITEKTRRPAASSGTTCNIVHHTTNMCLSLVQYVWPTHQIMALLPLYPSFAFHTETKVGDTGQQRGATRDGQSGKWPVPRALTPSQSENGYAHIKLTDTFEINLRKINFPCLHILQRPLRVTCAQTTLLAPLVVLEDMRTGISGDVQQPIGTKCPRTSRGLEGPHSSQCCGAREECPPAEYKHDVFCCDCL
ncbi:hypothetical protein PR048_003003 [Dryococelus australis]|uniref:Uncharacterized protein n=1 Tax=Dryococelus australis TaxID=614101 RepID=A0ABQ9IN81_9NEOP|nr:hypothetical protein PR048_003003 [Dryococelus australis]